MKVEIQARKESNSQLRAENLHNLGRMSASMHKVDKKVEVILEAQKMLHSYHHALQVHIVDNCTPQYSMSPVHSPVLCSKHFV